MDRADILYRLKAHETALRARGVTHAALFGSRARGEDEHGSDTDILIEIDPLKPITIYDYAGIKDFVAGLFEGPVDVVRRDRLKPGLVKARSGRRSAGGCDLCVLKRAAPRAP